jgi:Protein of unknown function (DUF4239)
MPPWVLGPLFVLAFVGAALLIFWGVLRWASALRNKDYNATIGNFAGVIQALFGLTMGLVIVTLFNNYRDAQAGIRSEAIALAELARVSNALPPGVNAKLRGQIVKYIDDVREREWKLLRDGRTSDQAWGDIGDMYATLQGFEPKTSTQSSFYGQALSRMDDIVTERKNTLAAITEPFPSILQALLLIAAFVVITAPMFLVTVSRRFQAVKVAAVAAVIGTALFAAAVLDTPFSRALPVSDQPYRTSEFNQLAGP